MGSLQPTSPCVPVKEASFFVASHLQHCIRYLRRLQLSICLVVAATPIRALRTSEDIRLQRSLGVGQK